MKSILIFQSSSQKYKKISLIQWNFKLFNISSSTEREEGNRSKNCLRNRPKKNRKSYKKKLSLSGKRRRLKSKSKLQNRLLISLHQILKRRGLQPSLLLVRAVQKPLHNKSLNWMYLNLKFLRLLKFKVIR